MWSFIGADFHFHKVHDDDDDKNSFRIYSLLKSVVVEASISLLLLLYCLL